MSILQGVSKCIICGQSFDWSALKSKTPEGGTVLGGAPAEVCATGRINTTDGVKVTFDVIAKCPHCGGRSKFTTTN